MKLAKPRVVLGLSVALAAFSASIALFLSPNHSSRRVTNAPAAMVDEAGSQVQTSAPAPAPKSELLTSTRAVAAAATKDPAPLPAAGALPDRLDAVPTTPWREAQLARYTPQERSMLDYKLGLMSRMRACAASIPGNGTLKLFLHYTIDPGTGTAKGSSVEPLDSSLDRGSDAAALDCVHAAHADSAMPLPEAAPDQLEFHWATEIAFPLKEDRAYQFFAH
jgi:hypothetical protein